MRLHTRVLVWRSKKLTFIVSRTFCVGQYFERTKKVRTIHKAIIHDHYLIKIGGDLYMNSCKGDKNFVPNHVNTSR